MTSLCVSVCMCIMGQESWASSSDFVPFLYKPLFKEHSINTLTTERLTTGRVTVIILPRVHCVRFSQTNVDSSHNISLSAGEPSGWASSAAPAEYISSCVSFLPCASENVMTNAKGSKRTNTSPYLIRDGLYLCAYHLNRKGYVLPQRQKFRPCLRLRIQWHPFVYTWCISREPLWSDFKGRFLSGLPDHYQENQPKGQSKQAQ